MDTLRKVYVEATSRCNLNCRMCFRNTWLNGIFEDMPPATFDALLEEMPSSVETVLFGGMGEPLIHQDIISMVARIAAAGKHVALVSNASLLTREVSRQLLQAGLRTLWVSLDAFDEAEYQSIRKRGQLAVVLSHLHHFNQERRSLGRRVELCINFVAMKSNVTQLRAIPAFLARFKVDTLNISNLIPSDKASESELLYRGVLDIDMGRPVNYGPQVILPFMDWRLEGVLEGIRSLFSTSHGMVSLSGQPLSRKSKYCTFVEEGNAFIRLDGEVSPCMALLHGSTTYWGGVRRTLHHHSFGNVLNSRLEDIWQSLPYSDFRRRVKEFDFSPCMRCSGCDDWEQNVTDCFGNEKPVCGACLWAEGLISCP
jgi:MoaA/NifB/PqqE/SkfB family radical SAM enzyme